MKTIHLKTSDRSIARAANIIKKGGLVAFPTETVYGLGGSAENPESAKKIYAAKGRPSDNPLIIHIYEAKQAEKYARTSELYYKLTDAFCPGPLTVIMPKKDAVPYEVTGGLDTVAVRIPSHPDARRFIAACGVAIAAPSANASGSPSPTTAKHVAADMDGRIDAIIDGGECEIGLESTIVLLKDGAAVIRRRYGRDACRRGAGQPRPLSSQQTVRGSAPAGARHEIPPLRSVRSADPAARTA